jgi:hypothetical protein
MEVRLRNELCLPGTSQAEKDELGRGRLPVRGGGAGEEQEAGGGKQKAEGRRQKAEGGKQEAEGGAHGRSYG